MDYGNCYDDKWKDKMESEESGKGCFVSENPPQIHSTKFVPMYGIADKRLVMTVAPQNDICPHGRTYPINAVDITVSRRITPIFHVSRKV